MHKGKLISGGNNLEIEDLTLGIRILITAGPNAGKIGIVVAKGTQTILLDIGESSLIDELPEHLESASEDPLPLSQEVENQKGSVK